MRKIFLILGIVGLWFFSYASAVCENRALEYDTQAACLADGGGFEGSDSAPTGLETCQAGFCSFCETDAAEKECCMNKCLDRSTNEESAGFSEIEKSCECKCSGGTVLNTDVPFLGRCISLGGEGSGEGEVNQLTAFPRLMKALTNIMLSLILIASLIMVIAGGVMIASSGAATSGYESGKQMIRKVIIGLILLGASGIILALINPNFFG